MIKLSRGELYPFPLANKEGASANFLGKNGNILQIALPSMTAKENTALRSGVIKAGFLHQDDAILWLFQLHDNNGKPLLTLDAPFDVRMIDKDNLALHSITNTEQRLAIEIHAVDERNILRALRVVTIPNELTIKFLAAAQDQLVSSIGAMQPMQEWMKYTPAQLATSANLYILGK